MRSAVQAVNVSVCSLWVTARSSASASLPGSCCQFHVHLRLCRSAHCTDQTVQSDWIWEGSLPTTHDLRCSSNRCHYLLYPFEDLLFSHTLCIRQVGTVVCSFDASKRRCAKVGSRLLLFTNWDWPQESTGQTQMNGICIWISFVFHAVQSGSCTMTN